MRRGSFAGLLAGAYQPMSIPLEPGDARHHAAGGGGSPVRSVELFFIEDATNRANAGSSWDVRITPPGHSESLKVFKSHLRSGSAVVQHGTSEVVFRPMAGKRILRWLEAAGL